MPYKELNFADFKDAKAELYRLFGKPKQPSAALREGGGCFTVDTLILMEKGAKYISDIKVGDIVLTVDSKGNRSSNHVIHTIHASNDHYYLINGEIKVTQLHRFLTSKGWKRVYDLQLGDLIQTSEDSFVKIHSKKLFTQNLKVYNLEIANNHNFFVSSDGKSGYLVHNTAGGGK